MTGKRRVGPALDIEKQSSKGVVCNEMKQELVEEEKKMRRLRFIVDLAQAVLMQSSGLTLKEAFEIMNDTKRAALNMFPDKEHVYELVYAPRFRRIISDRFVISGGLSNTD